MPIFRKSTNRYKKWSKYKYRYHIKCVITTYYRISRVCCLKGQGEYCSYRWQCPGMSTSNGWECRLPYGAVRSDFSLSLNDSPFPRSLRKTAQSKSETYCHRNFSIIVTPANWIVRTYKKGVKWIRLSSQIICHFGRYV